MRAGFPPGFQQDDRPELRFVTGLHKFRIPDRRFRPVRVYIGIFEQTGPKNIEQQPYGGTFEPLPGRFSPNSAVHIR